MAVIVGAGLYLGADGWQTSYEHEATDRAQYYQDTARERARERCIAVPRSEIRSCVYEQFEASRESERKEYDLQAQLVTSAWTRAMGIAAIIGMAVGIFGISLIFKTFEETRNSANEARRAATAAEQSTSMALAQSAPDIEIGVVLIVPTDATATVPQFLHIDAVNVGHTEAKDVRFNKVIVSTGDGRLDRLSLEVMKGRDAVVDIPHNRSGNGFPFTHDSFVFDVATVLAGGFTGVEVAAEIAFSYRDFMGKDYAESGIWSGVLEETRNPNNGQIENVRSNLARIQ